MSSTKLKKIVFVCTGNTCRSPMAEYLFKQALKKKKLRGFKVTSAGVRVKKGDGMHPNTAYLLEENGIKLGKFSSAPITDKLLKEAFFFICMTEEHKDYLMEKRWQLLCKDSTEEIENNVYSFAEFAGYDIPDPYGRDIEAYRYVYELLEGGMYALIDNLSLQKYALPATKRSTSDGTKKRGRPRKNPLSTENT